jgi:hypothetical protein
VREQGRALLGDVVRAGVELALTAQQRGLVVLDESSAAWPATASMRRVPAAMAISATILTRPISPVVVTWVPPQSSRL